MNRKEFLELIGRGALFAASAPSLEALADAAAVPPPRPRPLTTPQRAALRALADEIVPAADGMTAAGELGAVAYLEPLARRDQGVAAALRGALASLERMAHGRHRSRFERLPPPQRVALLEAMEKEDADRFRAVRDLVYEAYYTNPEVGRRLGYDFIGPEASGPPLPPFEEALLERVRAMPRLCREVP